MIELSALPKMDEMTRAEKFKCFEVNVFNIYNMNLEYCIDLKSLERDFLNRQFCHRKYDPQC